MIEASKIPLPDADKKLKLKPACSAAGLATTGGTRRTSLSRPRTGIFGAAIPSRNPFVCGSPQTKTTTLRIIQGSQAWNISDFELRIADFSVASSVVQSTGSLSRQVAVLASNRQILFGCQNRRKVASAAIDTIEETTFT